MISSDSTPSARPLKLAISTCPNDTFAFHAILNRKIDLLGLEFEIELLDIQQLNDGLLAQRFDVAKASFHAALRLADQTIVLPSGSALGFGVGPLLLASEADSNPNRESGQTTLTLCPGELTTATMLFKLFYSAGLAASTTRIDHCVFSEIMPSLKFKTADFGVCIHEGRFTWEEEGLSLVEDLGTRWEKETDSPLPLGGIVARRGLPDETIATIQKVIQSSIRYGLANRAETISTMRKYAQEFSDDVLMSHVDLYVNEWTVDLGIVGKKALQMLATQAIESSLVPADSRRLEIWQP
jgi:1,4-dihydroxy-6-naphthoate synthase